MKKFKIILIVIIILVVAGFLFWKLGNRSISIGNNAQQNTENEDGISPITGEKCANYNRRPFAVMLATDAITRPLSGISQADIVIEMPVITGGTTRLMAVYGCESPDEIGSIRSARHDYIPLAMGLDAIYAHWGGSHFALDKLDKGIMDNLDAMKNPYDSFFRKPGIAMPHDGFTTMDKLLNAAKKLGYRLETKFSGYPHLKKSDSKLASPNTGGRLSIGYGGEFRVSYAYDKEENLYERYRNNLKETDKNNNNQVKVSVVIIMRAESRMIEPPDYNEVDVEGDGEAKIFQNGEEIKGYWKKTGTYSDSKLTFLNSNGKEIELAPGKIWLQIVEPTTEVKWETF
ncbi:MAG TPA: DUF3048 domain-containing protein [Candidatus Paceibacterota bacterium]|nr:DUF3048 domain-containing protein [Candidatus Paceibacterota bacterium]